MTINFNTILSLLAAKFGAEKIQMLATPGTYSYHLGFSLPIGIEQAGGGGLTQLYPQSQEVGGFGLSGILTLL